MDSDKQRENKRQGVGNNGNLIPCQPGETRNPKGRPKGSVNLTNAIKRILKQVAEQDKKGRKYADLFAESLIVNAIKGNGTAIKELLNRVDGPVTAEPDTSKQSSLSKLDELLAKLDGGANGAS